MKNNKIKMTAHEVMVDLRMRGFPISQKTFSTFIDNGMFPFVKVLSVGDTGRRTFLILRRDYEAWVTHYTAENAAQ